MLMYDKGTHLLLLFKISILRNFYLLVLITESDLMHLNNDELLIYVAFTFLLKLVCQLLQRNTKCC